jgi:hypothetical protein
MLQHKIIVVLYWKLVLLGYQSIVLPQFKFKLVDEYLYLLL